MTVLAASVVSPILALAVPRLSADRPLLLLLLVFVPVLVLASRAATRRQRAATWVRATAVTLLVLAVAGLQLDMGTSGVDVAFLVDASDSVGGSGQAEALAWVEEAVDARPETGRAALGVFGREPRLEHALRHDLPLGGVASVVDPSGTDIARALRLGQGVLGSERRRRAVLLTDGNETSGDAARTARDLAEAGIAVDVVPLTAAAGSDVLVDEVVAPARVHEGEAYDVTVRLRNTGGRPVEVTVALLADGDEVHRETVTAAPGATDLTVSRVAGRDGTVRYEARLLVATPQPANDAGRASVLVTGPPRVLVVEAEDDAGATLTRALRASGVRADRTRADALPGLDGLLRYESVVLVDVPVTAIGPSRVQTLDTYVRDAGHGLVAVGGEDSFALGEYEGTAIEDLLPVFARVTDPKRRLSVAEALVVDVSGSMAACHCQDGGFGGGGGMGGATSVEGGVSKTEISKEAVARAVDALSEQDTLGVLAFNTSAEWVIPLQNLPGDAVVDEGLARLHPQGGTSVPQAVREAITGLKDVEARLRHIVLFTDGFTDESALVPVAREAREAGVTLSVVGTGEGASTVLEEMAAAGGGRYYPGRDLLSIPDVIVNEVQLAARPVVQEGRFVPVVTGDAPATRGLDAAPPLLGYLATTSKPTARTLLSVGDENDPLLASWRAGLGTAVAWTSDGVPRWSAPWVGWERFSRFWSDVVRSTFPAEADARFDLTASASATGIEVGLEAARPVGADVDATVTVTSPDGRRVEVPLERRSLTSFGASLPGAGQGVYAVTARLVRPDAGEVLFQGAVTAIRSYSPEYALGGGADEPLLRRVAEASGGRYDPAPASTFDAAGLAAGLAARPLAAWLALLALILLPVDVGLRRLRLERADWGRARRWVRDRLRRLGRRGSRTAERRESTAGLLAAKRRAQEQREDEDRSGNGKETPPD